MLMNLFFKEGMGMQMQRMDLWALWGKERAGPMKKVALMYMH